VNMFAVLFRMEGQIFRMDRHPECSWQRDEAILELIS